MKSLFKNSMKIILIFFISLIYLVLFELILRSSIFFKTGEKDYFLYGFNKNFEFEVVDLTEFKFNINDMRDKNKENYKKSKRDLSESKKIIWTFGASLTHGFACGNNSSSWPEELMKLNNTVEIVNFGFPSIYSEDSIKILINNFENEEVKKPDFILWAHRDEEKLAVVRGIKRNRDRITNNFSFDMINQNNFFLMRIEKTLYSNSISYSIFKHMVDKIKKRYNFYNTERQVQKNFTNQDYEILLKNFEINTLDAIKKSFENGTSKFFIISLFTDDEFTENDKSFYFKEYVATVEKIQKKSDNEVIFINTLDFLSISEMKNFESYYCSNKHYTLSGNQILAKIINNFVNK